MEDVVIERRKGEVMYFKGLLEEDFRKVPSSRAVVRPEGWRPISKGLEDVLECESLVDRIESNFNDLFNSRAYKTNAIPSKLDVFAQRFQQPKPLEYDYTYPSKGINSHSRKPYRQRYTRWPSILDFVNKGVSLRCVIFLE